MTKQELIEKYETAIHEIKVEVNMKQSEIDSRKFTMSYHKTLMLEINIANFERAVYEKFIKNLNKLVNK